MPFPTGIIVLWHGAIVDIPDGWTLCDGTAGTPDLRDRFVVAAGGGWAPGATGGTLTHTHTFTSNGHHHHFPYPGGDFADGTNISDQTSTETDTGTTDPENHLPPYYALAYIMKT